MNYNDSAAASSAKVLFDAGMMVAVHNQAGEDGLPYLVVPKDARVEDLERLLPAPSRIRVKRELHDPDSFIEYVNTFCEPGTVIFFDQNEQNFTAILDHHLRATLTATEGQTSMAPPTPRWCSHVASYTAETTPEWLRWTARNGQRMNQADFAQFLENNVEDLLTHDKETMTAVALNLEIKKTVAFNSSQTLTSGATQLLFSEDVKGSAQSGQMNIPATFALLIAPFRGGAPRMVTCRLRYRLQDRAVVFWYDIAGHEQVVKEALAEIREKIDDETGVPLLAGKA